MGPVAEGFVDHLSPCERRRLVIYGSRDRRDGSPDQVRGVGPFYGGVAAAHVGGDRGPAVRPRRSCSGASRHGHREVDDSARTGGPGLRPGGGPGDRRTRTRSGCWSEAGRGPTRGTRCSPRSPDRSSNPWRSPVGTALDVEEHNQAGGRTAEAGIRDQRGHGWPNVARQRYSLQSTRKRLEGTAHIDRNAQFEHIAALTKAAGRRHGPIISVDTKKKELVGRFTNAGREWHPAGEPEQVKVHDFPPPGQGKAIPYGIYDVGRNEGFVSVGITADTAEFAVASIRLWWHKLGRRRYPNTGEVLITADCGGSNSYRCRLWKVELQALADETGLKVRVAHYPPGTSKWNKIEHRLFCQITTNWRGRPLTSYQAVVDLISATKTTTGLTVLAHLDTRIYQKGREVSDAEIASLRIKRDDFHGEWNYVLLPRAKR